MLDSLLITTCNKGYSVKFNQYPDDENSGADMVVKEIEYPFSPYPSGMDYSHIVSSCNGLLYLVNKSSPDDAVLFNPLTGTYCKIPDITRVEALLPSERFDDGIRQSLSGFLSFTDWFCSCVYDEVNDDYKVVGIKVEQHMKDRVCETSSWIYSTKSGTWRRTADQMPGYNIAPRKSGVYVCNALHWVLYDYEDDPKYVAAFNVGTEKFRLLPLPPDYHLNEYSKLNLGVLDGCLSLCCYWNVGDYHSFEVWMMREYGIENWDRLMKLSHDYDFSNIVEVKTLALSANGKLLLLYVVEEVELPYLVEESDEDDTIDMHRIRLFDVETGSIKSGFSLRNNFGLGGPHLHIPSLVNPNFRACN